MSSAGWNDSRRLAYEVEWTLVETRAEANALTPCQGRNETYNELVSQFRSLLPSSAAPPPSTVASSSSTPELPTTQQLRSWLEALTHVVSKLDKTHAPLVETILAIPWATMEENFVGAYIRFIGALVSARMEWLRSVLERCVKGFKYRSFLSCSRSILLETDA